jgi:hypothetical protein
MPRLDATVDISEKRIQELLSRPDSFLPPDIDGLFETWSIGPSITHRDATLLEQANAKALLTQLESDPSLKNSWKIVRCSHWAVGWCEHLAFQVIEKINGNAKPTRIARFLEDWFQGLADYPCADDSLLSELEYNSAIEYLQQEVTVRTGAPDDWADQLRSHLYRHFQDSMEYHSDGTPYWDEDSITASLTALGFQPLDDE